MSAQNHTTQAKLSDSVFLNETWAKTVQGRPIPLYQSSHIHQPILFIGGVHGDEPEGVELACRWLNLLKSKPELKPGCGWALIPCLNVDGFLKATRGNGRGVDLNRNYPSKGWSEVAKSERYNPGPSPGSEPEVQAVVDYISNTKPRLIVHFHSWKPCIIATGKPAEKWGQFIAQHSRYPLKPEIGYPTPGGLSEYGWHDHQIPVICVEAQERSDLKEVWPRFSQGLTEMIKALKEEST